MASCGVEHAIHVDGRRGNYTSVRTELQGAPEKKHAQNGKFILSHKVPNVIPPSVR